MGRRAREERPPAPFPLKYIEIGNEQQGARYGQRVAEFYKAIKARYPQMKVALSSWIAGLDRRAIDAVGPIDIIDEHAYKALNWSIENFDSFAAYKREAWELYIGEFATNAGVGRGNWAAAIGDAAYMMSVEKNTDLVKMASYAPLLENVNHRDWEVNMIHFDSSRVFPRATYYVQKLFAEHLPSVNLKTAVTYTPNDDKAIDGPRGRRHLEYRGGVPGHSRRARRQDRVSVGFLDGSRADGRRPCRTRRAAAAPGPCRTARSGRAAMPSRSRSSMASNAARHHDHACGRARSPAPKASWSSAAMVDGRRVQWNVAGWGNTQSAIQASDSIVGRAVRGGIETGRWYDLRLEVRGRTVRGYLDGNLLNEATYPRVDTVLAIAGRDDRTGEIIIKALNTGPDAAAMTFDLSSAPRVAATGTLTVLSVAKPARRELVRGALEDRARDDARDWPRADVHPDAAAVLAVDPQSRDAVDRQ